MGGGLELGVCVGGWSSVWEVGARSVCGGVCVGGGVGGVCVGGWKSVWGGWRSVCVWGGGVGGVCACGGVEGVCVGGEWRSGGDGEQGVRGQRSEPEGEV